MQTVLQESFCWIEHTVCCIESYTVPTHVQLCLSAVPWLVGTGTINIELCLIAHAFSRKSNVTIN